MTYSYDNCGNMLGHSQGGTNISSTVWTSFNKVSTLYNGNDGSEFTYDINHSRIAQISFKDGAGTKKLYLGGFEQTEELTGGNQHDRANWQWTHKETRVFVSTPSGGVGIHVQDIAENVERKYLHKNHLGSIVAVSGEGFGGTVSLLAEYSFDAWGKRRSAETWLASAVNTSSLETDRGFTGHEMLDNVGLVHMNGRIYDATLGRFLSADPIVQAPSDLQSYNRYSYVRNNPLTLTDPSGYSWLSKAWKKAKSFVKKYWVAIVGTVIAVVVTILTLGLAGPIVGSFAAGVWGSVLTGAIAGAAGGFAAGFSGTLLTGGSLGDAFRNGLTGAAWGAVAGAVGGYINVAAWGQLTTALAHGVTGSAISLAQGGSWETGFLAGFGAGAISGAMGEANLALKTLAAALVGGTASAIGGGKFAAGAVTGAFALLIGEGFKKLGEIHQSRNQKNNTYWEKEGFAERDNIDLEEFGGIKGLTTGTGGYIGVDAANSHRIGSPNQNNIKITTAPKGPRWWNKYGRYEIILRPNGNGLYSVVTDSVNMGTLNYGRNIFTHTLLDVVPYLGYGNISNPTTNFGLRIGALLSGNKGYKLADAWGF